MSENHMDDSDGDRQTLALLRAEAEANTMANTGVRSVQACLERIRQLEDTVARLRAQPAPMVTDAHKLAAMETALRAIIDRVKDSDGSNTYNACVALDMKLIAVAALSPKAADAVTKCEWQNEDESEDGHSWGTNCGHVFYLDDGDPASNNMKFCTFCGGSLLRVYHKDQEDA